MFFHDASYGEKKLIFFWSVKVVHPAAVGRRSQQVYFPDAVRGPGPPAALEATARHYLFPDPLDDAAIIHPSSTSMFFKKQQQQQQQKEKPNRGEHHSPPPFDG
jgi:hypothetical protein